MHVGERGGWDTIYYTLLLLSWEVIIMVMMMWDTQNVRMRDEEGKEYVAMMRWKKRKSRLKRGEDILYYYF